MLIHIKRWLPEDDAKLLSLMDGVMTSAEITKVIGKFSRNSVMGRISRLRASGRLPPGKTLRPVKWNGKPSNPKPKSGIREKYVFEAGPPPPYVSKSMIVELAGRFAEGHLGQTGRVSIYDLKIDQCKFPIDQPTGGIMYCGLDVSNGGSWCRHHASRVFVSNPKETPDAH